MLLAINRILGAPVMSLQTGQPLCKLASPIINPYNLRIVAFYVDGPRLDFSPAVVFTEDIQNFVYQKQRIDHGIHGIYSDQSEIAIHDSHGIHGIHGDQSENGIYHTYLLQEIAIEDTIHTLDLDLSCCE